MAIESALARSRGQYCRRSDILRHCERSEAIQRSIRTNSLDCFVAALLAMTTRGSPLLRRNAPDPRRMRRDVVERIFQMHPLVGRHLLDGADACPPLALRADRPRHKTAAAVRANVEEFCFRAVRTERAFVGADARLQRVRG